MPDSSDALLIQLDQQLCFKLYAASRLMIKAYRPLLENMGVTYPQYLVLIVLWEAARPMSVGELGERLLLDSGTLTPLLKRLATQGLVSRERGQADERQVWVSTTEQGRALQHVAIGWLKHAVGRLDAPDLDVGLLKDQLAKLLAQLG
ncbi:MarR family winged helix-turn-helix transcriptional regulator [Simiduia sp. 21SJ11W-1]|uniref:MarR family winged helix-turn-helix transcriptional regulator n=1 Tax=Simiduia sp. 21SJ11W-1 TaxID=2909669 RepID=UPI00273A7403|nr:MarR family transcriptional regulator [Simiduia sp. 21SJ11W-1]